MKAFGGLSILGLMFLGFRALLVGDVANGYFDCQMAMLKMTERPHGMTYQERQALQKQAEAVCQTSLVKAKLAQAVLAPASVRD